MFKCGPDLAPEGFHFSIHMKQFLSGHNFREDTGVKEDVLTTGYNIAMMMECKNVCPVI